MNIHDLLKEMAHRAEVPLAEMTAVVSSDPIYLYRKRPLSFSAVERMLEALECNLADLAYELRLEPSLYSWPIVLTLEQSFRQSSGRQNERLLRLAARLDELRLERPGRVVSFLERVLPRLSGKAVVHAATILGPALRALGAAAKAAAVLQWVGRVEGVPPKLKARALRWLSYALASDGRIAWALAAALEAQDLFRMQGNQEQAARGEIEKAMLRFFLGDRHNARKGFSLALDMQAQLDARSRAAAFHGLAVLAIEDEDIELAATALEQSLSFEGDLPPMDIGKLRWGQGRLSLLLGKRAEAVERLLEASAELAKCRSEDAIRVFIDLLIRVRPTFDERTLTKLIYSRASSAADLKIAEQVVRAYAAQRFSLLEKWSAERSVFPLSLGLEPPAAISAQKVLQRFARRAGVAVSQISGVVSNDPRYLYRRRRRLLSAIEAMLESLGCNLADVVYERRQVPSWRSWHTVRVLEESWQRGRGRHDARFEKLAARLDRQRLDEPERVAALLEKMLSGLSRTTVCRAATILGPSLRALGQSGQAAAVLRWVVEREGDSLALRARALRWLSYALASDSRLSAALHCALEAQDIHRLLEDHDQVARGEIEKAILRHLQGDVESSRTSFSLALSMRERLDTRSLAAAIHGLAVNAITTGDREVASEAMREVVTLEEALPRVDIGKIRWAQGRLHFLLDEHEEAVQCLLESSRILAELRSEDALRVFVEMLVLMDGQWGFSPNTFTTLIYQRAKTPRGVRLAGEIAQLYCADRLAPRLTSIYTQIGAPLFSTPGQPVLETVERHRVQ